MTLKLQTQPQPRPQPQPEVLSLTTSDAYWAGILKTKTDLELQLPKIREELRSLQISNEELERQKSSLSLDIKNLKTENKDLQHQMEYNQKIMDSIAQELVREKNDKIQLQERYKRARNENKILVRQLNNLNSQKIDFRRKFQILQKEKTMVEQRFTEMEAMLINQISQVNNLKEQLDAIRSERDERSGTTPQMLGGKRAKESVELPPIVVRPSIESKTQETPATPLGKVLAVDKENNFVIIDLGEDAGVRMGDIFEVYREDITIAFLEVIQTRKDIAACDIKKGMSPIKIGDTIR
jgi:predicted nuclease with TOPRIM domain